MFRMLLSFLRSFRLCLIILDEEGLRRVLRDSFPISKNPSRWVLPDGQLSKRISSDLFNAFLKCSTKCWLRAAGEPASGNPYAEWMQSENGSYHEPSTMAPSSGHWMPKLDPPPKNCCRHRVLPRNHGALVALPLFQKPRVTSTRTSVPSERNTFATST